MNKNTEILTSEEKRVIVKKLMEIVKGNDQKLSYRAITRIMELEKQSKRESI